MTSPFLILFVFFVIPILLSVLQIFPIDGRRWGIEVKISGICLVVNVPRIALLEAIPSQSAL
jgi:hypothetical protein